MSELNRPPATFYFLSCLYDTKLWAIDKITSTLAPFFQIDESFSPEFNPSLPYYTKEMGSDLKRIFFIDHSQKSREHFIDLKILTTEIEKKFGQAGKRTINLDPGQLNLENMILATGKPYAHRIYLGSGVYSDLNYVFQNKTYQTLPWTYPDYAHPEKISFFNQLRSRLY